MVCTHMIYVYDMWEKLPSRETVVIRGKMLLLGAGVVGTACEVNNIQITIYYITLQYNI